ncbi:MAG: rhomboid family intramembrane serine protease [Planctomycetales bacterium]|nr:rhomboid family intramembrane serine protease [Planctomycetales bacterium]
MLFTVARLITFHCGSPAMLIPYGTDAPIYHLPFATGAMIALNVVASFAVWVGTGGLWYIDSPDGETLQWVKQLTLMYGHGLRPWQWVTSNFLHADILHLASNMFGLWGFGIVVEGKIGWKRFLMVYFGIGIAQGAVEQTMMLFASGGASLGASSIIYGLLAIAMVWAPRNEMQCAFVIYFRPIFFEAQLYTIACVLILMEIGTSLLAGLSWGSQILHLMGAAAGFAVGFYMLKKKMVDCEGWDLLNVWAGREGQSPEERHMSADDLLRQIRKEESRKKQKPVPVAFINPTSSVDSPHAAPATTPAAKPAVSPPANQPGMPLVIAMREAIAQSDPRRAWELYQEFISDPLNWPVPYRELLQTISLFHKRREWMASVPAMESYLEHNGDQPNPVRLKLAQILLEIAKQPDRAAALLEPIEVAQLNEREAALYQKLKNSLPTGEATS